LQIAYNRAEQNFRNITQTFKNNGGNSADLSYIIKKGKIHHEVVGQASLYEDGFGKCINFKSQIQKTEASHQYSFRLKNE